MIEILKKDENTLKQLKAYKWTEPDDEPIDEDKEIELRTNVNDIYEVKLAVIKLFQGMSAADRKVCDLLETIGAYGFYRFDKNFNTRAPGEDWLEKTVDQKCWHRMVEIYQLEKYMLCTEYDKLSKQIEQYNFPVFNVDNAQAWLDDLKRLVYESVGKLISDVFERIVTKTYETGSSYSTRQKKKRNNNGIDKNFIITTYDSNRWNHSPTITDDLEKACYIIDGKLLPEQTIKSLMSSDKVNEYENDYFKIKIHKNGNTHYWIKDDMRAKLNYYGAKRGVIGEKIRIKIFEKKG